MAVSSMGSDGAAGPVLASGAKARALGLHVIAKLRGYADAEQVFWIHQPATTF
jgi:acetyl-CoA acetyltransferase